MVRFAVALLMVLLVPSAAYAEKRIALLIGNQAYANEIGPLANPHNDVALLEKTLKALNFEVAVERDASLGALTRAVNAYAPPAGGRAGRHRFLLLLGPWRRGWDDQLPDPRGREVG